MTQYILNAISGNMLDLQGSGDLAWHGLSLEQVKKLLASGNWVSALGHDDIALLLSEMTGFHLTKNRITNKLNIGDRAILAQYSGPRLEEGATKLPDGATILFALIEPFPHISRQLNGDGTIVEG